MVAMQPGESEAQVAAGFEGVLPVSRIGRRIARETSFDGPIGSAKAAKPAGAASGRGQQACIDSSEQTIATRARTILPAPLRPASSG